MSEQNTQLQKSENRLITQAQIKFAEDLGQILKDVECIKEQTNPIIMELMFANAKAQIEKLLTDEIMENIYKLFGDPSGVKMDKQYSNEVKKRIFIQASMEGFSVRGGQINVIGGNMYRTALGYLPKLRKIPNFTFVYPFRHRIPVKDAATFTTTVTTDMEWTKDGIKHKESVTYPVARQDGQGNDAILGKANTKMCSWLWNKVTGEDTIDDSGVFVDAEVVSSTTNTPIKEEAQSEEIKAESVSEKISDEWQLKFNAYIGKKEGSDLVAKSSNDLVKRATVWCDSKTAKEIGVKYSIGEDGSFLSESLNLGVFNQILESFKTN